MKVLGETNGSHKVSVSPTTAQAKWAWRKKSGMLMGNLLWVGQMTMWGRSPPVKYKVPHMTGFEA